MEFRILGPLDVVDNGRQIDLGAGKQRALLAILLLHPNQVVSSAQLIDALWGEQPPPTAPKALQRMVSQLRRALGEQSVVTRAPGYALSVDADAVDAQFFERLVTEGRRLLAEDPEQAADLMRRALALWRGPPLGDFADHEFAREEINRLDELAVAALEDRFDAELRLGCHTELVPELEVAVRRHPLRERLRAQLMLALYRSDRQADALSTYHDGRRLLVEELGLEPGQKLRDLERAILNHDPSLELEIGAREPAPGPVAKPLPGADGGANRARRRRIVLFAGIALLALAAAAVSAIALARGGEAKHPLAVVPDSLVKIDPTTNDIVQVVRVGTDPLFLASVGKWLLMVNGEDRTLSRVDRAGNVRTFGVNTEWPWGLAADPHGYIWVGSYYTGELAEVTPDTLHVVRRMSIPDSSAWPSVVGAGSVWVSGAAVYRIGLSTGHVVRKYPVDDPGAIVVYDNYAFARSLQGLVRIDIAEGSFDPVSIPSPIAVAAGFGSIWVSSFTLGRVYRVEPASDTIEAVIKVGDGPLAIARGVDAMWVTNEHAGTISRIDPRTNTVTATIRTGFYPKGITVVDGFVWATVSSLRF